MPGAQLIVRHLGLQAYKPIWHAMSRFTDDRDEDTLDELWLVQHHPVFTQGQAGKAEHVLDPGDIPIVQSDRGGQVTYHGPGQLVIYPLINLRRRQLGVREMVTLLEQLAIDLFEHYGLDTYAKADAPGVYVSKAFAETTDKIKRPQENKQESKIASLGLRVRKGCCFHGMSINVDMDLSPFAKINPCGYAGMRVTQLKDELEQVPDIEMLKQTIIAQLANKLGVTQIQQMHSLPDGYHST